MALTRRLIALAAALASVAVACTSADPAGPSAADNTPATEPLSRGGARKAHGELRCIPLPPAYAQKKIGPAGGELRIGLHRLTIPAGALTKTINIAGEVPTDTVASIRFSPEGLTFTPGSQVRLKLDYNTCPGGRTVSGKTIVYTDEAANPLEVLPSVDDVLRGDVEAVLGHFSRYAISY